MRRIWILAVVALVVASAAAKASKMPNGSFLNARVTTVDQLSQQVVNDAIVAARYAKHFQMPRNSVVDFFQSNLRAAKLLANYDTTVYTISGKTDAVATRTTLMKGTYVFIDRTGQPILEADTGNPLADRLPITLTTEPSAAKGVSPMGNQVPGASSLSAQDGVVTRVLGTQPAELGTIAPVAVAANAAAALQPAVEIVNTIPFTASVARFSRISAMLPMIAAVGGAAAIATGGGGSVTKNTGGNGGGGQVPEPSSISVLLFGASGLALRRYRLRK